MKTYVKVESQLQRIEAEELLSPEDQKLELIRAKDVAKRQADLQDKEEKSQQWKSTMEERRGNMQIRWDKMEQRRRARMQYYHAKIHHNNNIHASLQTTQETNPDGASNT